MIESRFRDDPESILYLNCCELLICIRTRQLPIFNAIGTLVVAEQAYEICNTIVGFPGHSFGQVDSSGQEEN